MNTRITFHGHLLLAYIGMALPSTVFGAPTNDNFADASALSGGFAQAAGTNVDATAETGEPQHYPPWGGGKSVWWTWTAPSSGQVSVSVAAGSFSAVVGVYTGSSVDALTQVTANWGSPGVTFSATSGTTYQIAVDGFGSVSGTFTLTLATPPSNDAFDGALALSGASVDTTGYNLLATKETGEPSHAGKVGNKSVWWTWTAPASGVVHVDTVGSSFNTLLAVYTGGSVDALTVVASDDDGGGDFRSALLFDANAGTTYRIAVDGLSGQSGMIALKIGPPPAAPANDNFADAVLISGATVSAEGSNLTATTEAGEPNHAGAISSHSVWWKWIAPTSSAVEVNHFGSSFGIGLLAVYTGTSVGSLTPVADSHAGTNNFWGTGFDAVAGTTYWIVVDSTGGWVKLNVLPATVPLITSWNTASGGNAGSDLLINDVRFSGTPPFAFQWTKDGVALTDEAGRIAGAQWSELTLFNLQEHDEGTYVLNISNWLGSDASIGNVLTVNTSAGWPVITTQPASQTVNAGDNVSFTVAATGTEPFTYRWGKNNLVLIDGGNISGATTATLTLTGATVGDAGNYTVLVTNSVGSVVSSPPAVLTVQTPVMTDQTITFPVIADTTYGAMPFALGATASSGLPVSYVVDSGPATVAAGTVTLIGAGPVTIIASQAGSISYNPAPDVSRTFSIGQAALTARAEDKSKVEGEPNPALTIAYTGFVNSETAAVIDLPPTIGTTATTGSPAGDYPITLTGGSDNNYALTLQDGTLTVNPVAQTPIITASPPSQVIDAGQPASFSVTATGTGPLTYQWKHNGRAIAGATSATLDLASATYADRGYYQVSITNAAGTASAFFHLNVSIPDVMVGAWGRSDEGQTAVPADLGAVVAVAAGYVHSLALKPDGSVAAWGANTYGQIDVPVGLSGVVALAAGRYHNLALKSDGTVAAWGRNESGQASVPAGLSGVVAIAAGYAHSLALKADGTVVAWGIGTYDTTTVPADLSGVIAIAAGGQHSLALKADGTVVGWGYNYYGEATVPVDLTDVVAVAAGANFSLALNGNGTVVAWGNNANGQAAVPAGLNGVVAIGGGSTFSLAARSDGTLLGWGNAVLGLTSAPTEFNGGIVALAAGGIHNLVLVSHAVNSAPVIDGQPTGQTIGTGASTLLTVAATGLWSSYQWQLDGVDIPGASSWMLSLSNLQTSDTGTYTVIVSNSAGSVTSSGAVLTVNGPTVITPPASQTVLTGHDASFTVAATGTGTLSYQWKHNGRIIAGANEATLLLAGVDYADRGYYEVSVSDAVSTTRAVCHLNISAHRSYVEMWGRYIPRPDPVIISDVVALSVSSHHGLALLADGRVVAWGYNNNGECDVPEGLTGVVAIAAGESHSLALRADGTVVAWGGNDVGQATVPSGLSDVVAIAAGWMHSLALKADGTVMAWGAGGSPEPAGLGDVVAIAAGWMHSLALKADGTVVGWGDNQYGQNDGTAGLSEIVAIASYDLHDMALKADGTVVAWGNSPTVPIGLSNVVAIAAGEDHDLALMVDGSMVAWGNNDYGQALVPSGLTDVAAVAGGYQITAILVQKPGPLVTAPYWNQLVRVGQPATFTASATGLGTTTYQWKRNGTAITGATTQTLSFDHVATADRGIYELVVMDTLGASSAYFRLETAEAYGAVVGWGASGTPGNEWANQGQITAPAGLSDVAAIAAGDYHTLALKADGTVTAWGADSLGQSTVPAALTGVTAIAGGSSHSLALKADGTAMAWGYGDQGTVPAGLGQIVAIAARQSYNLVLRTDGRVMIWGSPAAELTVPSGLSDVVAIAAGSRHALALKTDGTVVAWGRSNEGQTTVPAGLTGVVGIAAGYNHSLALKADGTVVGWGQGTEGQIAVPEGLNDVTAIAAGSYHSLARKADGTIVTWGWNGYRQTEVPAGLGNVAAVAGGEVHSLALFTGAPVTITLQPGARTVSAGTDVVFTVAASGTPPLGYLWRRNGVNLADGAGISGTTSPTLAISHVTGADVGDYSAVVTNFAGSVTSDAASLAVTLAASVVSPGQSVTFTAAPSGEGSTYQWSHNGRTINSANESTLSLTGVGYTDRGYYESVVTGSAGTTRSFYFLNVTIPNPAIIGWGSNFYGETSIPADLSGVVAMTSGWFHNLVLKADGTVSGWGHNGYGQTTIPAEVTNAVAIAACVYKSVALKADGTVVVWGASGWGGPIANEAVPADLRSVVAIDAGYSHCLALKADGTVTVWGDNSLGQCDVPADLSNVAAIAAGYYHNLALRADGTIVAWGNNYYGESTVPADLGSVIAISAGSNHNLAVKADGTVVAWGRNDYGQCSVPAGLTDVIGVMAGEVHSLALKADGTVVAWGRSSEGQTAVPAGLSGVLALAAGAQDSLAFLSGSAPAITLQPTSQSATAGDTVTLTVAATGTPPLSYQWRKGGLSLTDGGNVGGATTGTLNLANVQLTDAGSYSATIINAYGSTDSAAAVLTVSKLPATITVTSLAHAYDGTPKSAMVTTNPVGLTVVVTYDASSTPPTDAGSYAVEALVTEDNYQGGATDMLVIAQAPLTATADDKTKVEGAANPPLTYTYTGFVNGETVAVIDVPPVISTTATSGSPAGTYPITLTGGADNNYAITLQDGTLTVTAATFPPTITTQPADQTIIAGQIATLTVAADGAPAPGYQWQRLPAGSGIWSDLSEGGGYAGVSTATLTVQSATVAMSGDQFRCVAGNGVNPDAVSNAATLTVDPPPVFWSAHGGNAQRTGFSPVLGPTSASLKWTYEFAERRQDNANPVIGPDGTTYVPTEGAIYAVTAAGGLKWKKTYDQGYSWTATRSAPALSPDGTVLYSAASSGDNALVAMNASTGVIQWLAPLGGDVSYSSVAVGGDGVIYIGSRSPAAVHAINPDGAVKWTYSGFIEPQYIGVEAPVAVGADGQAYVVCNGNGFNALNASGGLRWQVSYYGGYGWPTPLVGPDGSVYVAGEDEYGFHDMRAFNADGTVRWVRTDLGTPGYFPGLAMSSNGAIIYTARANGSVHALYAATGKTLWSVQTAAALLAGSPVLGANGIIYLVGDQGSGNGRIYAISAFDGHALWDYELNSPWMFWGPQSPALGPDGTLYVVSSGTTVALGNIPSRLYAFQTESLPVAPAPAFTTQPVDVSVGIGQAATFTAVAAGNPPPVYQWQRRAAAGGDWEDLAEGGAYQGTQALTLQVSPAGAVMDGDQFHCVASNGVNPDAISDPATLTVNKLSQTITFGTLSNRTYGDPPFDLGATASSGLPVSFAVFGGPATIAGSTVTLTGTGTVTIRASQGGNETYQAAPEVDRSFEVLAAATGFDSWQQAQFTTEELLDPNVSGPNAVYGQDGLPNLLKYALGLDPKVNVTSGLPGTSTTATDWVYTYVRPSDRSDITYAVEVSTDLQSWSTAGVVHEQVSVEGGQETWHARYPLASAGNAFFRLKVTR